MRLAQTYNSIPVASATDRADIYATFGLQPVYITSRAEVEVRILGDLVLRVFVRCSAGSTKSRLRSQTGDPAGNGTELIWDKRGLDDGTTGTVIVVPEEARP
jgi:hypothetical protein